MSLDKKSHDAGAPSGQHNTSPPPSQTPMLAVAVAVAPADAAAVVLAVVLSGLADCCWLAQPAGCDDDDDGGGGGRG